jgi:hypothetical protein
LRGFCKPPGGRAAPKGIGTARALLSLPLILLIPVDTKTFSLPAKNWNSDHIARVLARRCPSRRGNVTSNWTPTNHHSQHDVNPMLCALRGEELGTPPHWDGASLVPDAPPAPAPSLAARNAPMMARRGFGFIRSGSSGEMATRNARSRRETGSERKLFRGGNESLHDAAVTAGTSSARSTSTRSLGSAGALLASRLSSSWLGKIAIASGCRQLAGCWDRARTAEPGFCAASFSSRGSAVGRSAAR